ncbi:MAG: hypothetical protein ACXVAY_13625 [Mucilaginibacter sp.]
MKRLIITTIILLVAATFVTIIYFKNVNTQGQNISRVMHTIPDNASFVFEFNNDDDFYDMFSNNALFTCVTSKQTLSDLDTLRKQLLVNSSLEGFFTGQNIFISVHPLQNNTIDLLITTSATKKFTIENLDELAKQKFTGLLITSANFGGKKGYIIYSPVIKKRFYLVNTEDNIFSGSFSKDLAIQTALYKTDKKPLPYTLLPDQQKANSLGALYVNYNMLNPLFEQLFKNKNTDIFKNMRLFNGLSALSLNYKSDALMFNGLTSIPKNRPISYLNLFVNQQPVVNHLKDIFPSTTAYSVSFAVSDPLKFKSDLSQFQQKAGLQTEKDQLFNQIKKETGINLVDDFSGLLSGEFAIVTTRYREKFGIVAVKNGSTLKNIVNGLSSTITEKTGQFTYNKLPFFLLGDAFNIFKKPYFMITDNYLILANSINELNSFNDSYTNHKFLNKTDQYAQFDNLLAERTNVAYFIQFKNITPLLKDDLNQQIYDIFEKQEPGWNKFYAASYQFVSADQGFYTNFCMRLNLGDSTTLKTKIE